jgi:hypothetical protein
MKRNISSKWTLPSKIFNFMLAIIPLVALLAAFNRVTPDEMPLKILLVALVIIWSLFFLFINYRLRFVSVDENNLYVSRLFKEETIPLSEIEDVSLTTIGFIWVRVRFKSETEFGRQIFFMPTLMKAFLSSFQRYHPVVEELKNLASGGVSPLLD